ncbi:hypothetical protein VMCG_05703 [Cytospora schulzeri]|uniref:Xylanolytic transcriptional activator regulatory domain-containing protein n=1 Tax=Cytospora schulzeri TaxID=448051 RepID=A0A423WI71_9PEZI|nr:hypothetical protein VMCG_05703 [Valsa malicola]
MPSHGVFALAKTSADGQDVLVQNYLERANFQYYPIFPEQLRGQSATWWEARAGGQSLSPELTCLLLRVCAVSTQYLEDSLLQRLEFELGEKAQAMTERFHAAATKLSASIPRGKGGVVQVQQLFMVAQWYKSEASMVESWHALSVAVREAQELNMHKPVEGLPNFERELRKRLWCIMWTWDWQMSTLLSRPLLIDQDDHTLEIPNGRLENINDPEIPHPLASVALQAELGLHVSHLFQKMSTDYSIQLVLEIEDELEKWMGKFPAALRDHRPDTRWDQKHPNVPFMRCQLNIVAYAYLLAPLKPYLLSTADPEVMGTQLGSDLRIKAVNTCLDLIRTSEQFYELIYPASIKYFFIIFFMFDAATVLCSAIVHDVNHTLPKRNQCIRSLRTVQELTDAVAHRSESARLSSVLLRKLATTLPLAQAEKQILGVGPSQESSKRFKASSSSAASSSSSSADYLTGIMSAGGGAAYAFGNPGQSMSSSSSSSSASSSTAMPLTALADAIPHSSPSSALGMGTYDMSQIHAHYAPMPMSTLAPAAPSDVLAAAAPPPDWLYMDYSEDHHLTAPNTQVDRFVARPLPPPELSSPVPALLRFRSGISYDPPRPPQGLGRGVPDPLGAAPGRAEEDLDVAAEGGDEGDEDHEHGDGQADLADEAEGGDVCLPLYGVHTEEGGEEGQGEEDDGEDGEDHDGQVLRAGQLGL